MDSGKIELPTKENFDAMQKKIEEIWISVEKTRKYFLWTLIATAVTFVLPLIGFAIAIPFFLRTISSAYSGIL